MAAMSRLLAAVPFLPAVIQGMTLSLGLIVAIGAQNAFVLRQGLRREHIGAVVLFCMVADVALVGAGVAGMSQALSASRRLARALALAGAAFLAVYGLRALLRMRRVEVLHARTGGQRQAFGTVMGQAIAFTVLNPHVYLDTVLLMGNMGARQPDGLRWWFVAGAGMGSALWFSLLGFGAQWLAPWFARPRAWQILDLLTGLTMCVLSVLLLVHACHGI